MKKKKKSGYKTTSLMSARRKRKKHDTLTKYNTEKRLHLVLEKTSQYLAIEADVNVILSRIASTLGKALGAKYVNFWELTQDKKSIYITAAYGMQKQYLQQSRKAPIRIGTAWIGRAVKTGKAWATSNVQKDPRLPRSWLPAVKMQNYHGLLCMPLMRKGEIIGGMCIYYKDVHDFEYFEMSLATIVANQAATALANARFFSDLLTERNKTLATIQSLEDGLIMYDPEDKIVLFNPMAENLLQLKAKEVIGKYVDKKLKEKSTYWKNLFNIHIFAKSDYSCNEYTTMGPKKLILEITNSPVYDSSQKKIGAMQVLRNITEEKRKTMELKKAFERIQKQMSELKEMDKMKSEFLSITSHELRTPMTPIKIQLQLLLENYFGKINQKQEHSLRVISRNAKRLNLLIKDILDVSRLESGKMKINPENVQLTDIIPNVIENAESTIKEKQLEVTTKLSKLPKIFIDKERIGQVITNLLNNAIKFTPNNGKITIETEKSKEHVMVKVSDTGIGIPEESNQKIFQSFVQLEPAATRKAGGTGLGLSICEKIIELHNGKIWVESNLGKGSVFYFTLPIRSTTKKKDLNNSI